MGQDRRVTFEMDKAPSWPAIADILARKNLPAQLRMIDGQLSFPDESPPETWRELRVSTPAGMITLRREGNAVVVVTWGNAAGPLLEAWQALAAAVAEVTHGRVESDEGGA